MSATAGAAATCPNCGAERIPGAAFCEACSFEFDDALAREPSPDEARQGEESPLDMGWTGPVATQATAPPAAQVLAEAEPVLCRSCGEGHYLDGYCDICGSKQPDPRDHYAEAPAPWVAGVCDLGKRHRRNEDAMALAADESVLSFAVLVVCDGVSNSTDSHIASLAATRAAREVLTEPLAQGVGTRQAVVAAAERRLDDAVAAAERAVVKVSHDAGEAAVESPPSCTFVAGLVIGRTAVVGNVGDSRAYWLPDAPESAATQLTADDSFAAEQVSAGIPRKEAETSPGAHAITRWLGVDSPDDITPHVRDVELTEDGWLLVCSDGLWNYCSEAVDLQQLVADTVARLGPSGLHPPTLAQALVDFANQSGGVDNVTVTLARVGRVGTVGAPPAEPTDPPQPSDNAASDTHTVDTPDTKDTP